MKVWINSVCVCVMEPQLSCSPHARGHVFAGNTFPLRKRLVRLHDTLWPQWHWVKMHLFLRQEAQNIFIYFRNTYKHRIIWMPVVQFYTVVSVKSLQVQKKKKKKKTWNAQQTSVRFVGTVVRLGAKARGCCSLWHKRSKMKKKVISVPIRREGNRKEEEGGGLTGRQVKLAATLCTLRVIKGFIENTLSK